MVIKGPIVLMPSINARLLVIASLIAQLGLAQPAPKILKLQDQAITSEQGSWIYMPLGDEPSVIQVPGKERQWVNSPSEGTRFGFRSARNGFIWDIRRIGTVVEGKTESHSFLYRHPEGQVETAWERVAELETLSGIPHYLIPLDRSGWFLGVGPYTGFFKDGRASYLALFRQQNERVVFEDLVEMPFRDRSHIGELESVNWPQPASSDYKSSNGELRKFKNTIVRPLSLSPDLWLPALLPDHLVLGASKAGVLWFFSLKNGQCQRTIDLGNVDAEELDKLGHLDHFLLAAQPDKGHRLLVVTRQPETLFFARALYTPPGVPKEVREGNHKRFIEIMEEYTRLQWWAIDPMTGSKDRIEDPISYPERTSSFAQQGKLRFLVGPDGRVHANTLGSWKDELNRLGVDRPKSLIQPKFAKSTIGVKEKKEEVKASPTPTSSAKMPLEEKAKSK